MHAEDGRFVEPSQISIPISPFKARASKAASRAAKDFSPTTRFAGVCVTNPVGATSIPRNKAVVTFTKAISGLASTTKDN